MPQTVAFQQVGPGTASLLELQVPAPGLDEALVEIEAVGLNPIDWKMLHRKSVRVPHTLGCDFVGIVRELGGTLNRIKLGDRVCGWTQGGNAVRPTDGAFTQFAVVPTHVLLRVPDHLSVAQSAALPTALLTAGFCLYKQLELPYPSPAGSGPPATNQDKAVFIYGGATAIGAMQIQLAKLSGLCVATTCSADSFDWVRKYGADVVEDYHDPHASANLIRSCKAYHIVGAVDCISNEESAAICAAVLERNGGVYVSCTAAGPAIETSRIKTVRIVAFTMLGRPFSFFDGAPGAPLVKEDVQFATEFAVKAEGWLKENKIQPLPVDVKAGGLEGISGGLEELRTGQVHRKRLVYLLEPSHNA